MASPTKSSSSSSSTLPHHVSTLSMNDAPPDASASLKPHTSPETRPHMRPAPPKQPVADSWDDDLPSAADDDDDDDENDPPTPIEPVEPTSMTSSSRQIAPPPKRTGDCDPPVYGPNGLPIPASNTDARAPARANARAAHAAAHSRPDKTTAPAARMIAAGLGQKVPKRTEEQRAYERAVREKVRREREAGRQREKERVRREEAEEVERRARVEGVWGE